MISGRRRTFRSGAPLRTMNPSGVAAASPPSALTRPTVAAIRSLSFRASAASATTVSPSLTEPSKLDLQLVERAHREGLLDAHAVSHRALHGDRAYGIAEDVCGHTITPSYAPIVVITSSRLVRAPVQAKRRGRPARCGQRWRRPQERWVEDGSPEWSDRVSGHQTRLHEELAPLPCRGRGP